MRREKIIKTLKFHRQGDAWGEPVDECSCGWEQSDPDDDCFWREHIATVLTIGKS